MSKVVALIPARAGSKGIRDKNIQTLNNLTLLEYAANVGVGSSQISETYISTDSKEYEAIALAAGCQSLGLRKAELSDDSASSVDVALDFIDSLEETTDILVLLQPTSPVRTSKQLDQCISLISNENCDAVIAVSKVEEPHPYKLKSIVDGRLTSFVEGKESSVPRQSLPPVYQLTGSIYVIKCDALRKFKTFNPPNTFPFVVDKFVNIDSELDLKYAEFLAKEKLVEFPK